MPLKVDNDVYLKGNAEIKDEFNAFQKKAKRTEIIRSLKYIFALIGVCVIMFFASFFLSFQITKPKDIPTINPDNGDGNESIIVENENLRAQVEVLQSQVDTLQAQVERYQALPANNASVTVNQSASSGGTSSTNSNSVSGGSPSSRVSPTASPTPGVSPTASPTPRTSPTKSPDSVNSGGTAQSPKPTFDVSRPTPSTGVMNNANNTPSSAENTAAPTVPEGENDSVIERIID